MPTTDAQRLAAIETAWDNWVFQSGAGASQPTVIDEPGAAEAFITAYSAARVAHGHDPAVRPRIKK